MTLVAKCRIECVADRGPLRLGREYFIKIYPADSRGFHFMCTLLDGTTFRSSAVTAEKFADEVAEALRHDLSIRYRTDDVRGVVLDFAEMTEGDPC